MNYLNPLYDFILDHPIVFSIIGGLLIFIYIGVPLIQLFILKQTTKIDCQLIDLEQQPLPQYIVRFLLRHKGPLLELGFAEVLTVQVEIAMSVTTMTMFSNPENGDRATICALHEPLSANSFFEFVTDLDDGREINTTNYKQIPDGVIRPPCQNVFTFPQVRAAAELYQNHQGILAALSGPAKRVEIPHSEILSSFLKSVEQTFNYQVEIGEMRLSGEKYRPTFFGTFAITWRLLPPFIFFRRWRVRRQSKKLAQKGGRHLNSHVCRNDDPRGNNPGNIAISDQHLLPKESE